MRDGYEPYDSVVIKVVHKAWKELSALPWNMLLVFICGTVVVHKQWLDTSRIILYESHVFNSLQ